MKHVIKTAREAIDRQGYAEAEMVCRSGLEEDPNNYMLLVLLGTSLSKTDDLSKRTKAMDCFEHACKEQPENALAWKGLVSTFYKDRVDVYVKAVRKLNDLLPAEMAEDLNTKAVMTLMQQKCLREAIELLDLKKSRTSNPVQILRQQMELWEQWEKETIEEHFKKQRYSLHAGSPSTLRARLTKEIRSQSKLGDVLKELLDWGTKDKSIFEKLILRCFEKEEYEALPKYLEQINVEEASLDVRRVVAELTDCDTPIITLENLDSDGESLSGLFEGCHRAFLENDYKAVVDISDKLLHLLNLAKFDVTKRKASTLKWRSIALCRLGRPEEATSDEPEALSEMVVAFEHQKRFDKAIECALKIPFDQDKLAWLYYNNKQYEQSSSLASEGDILLRGLLAWKHKGRKRAHALFQEFVQKDTSCSVAYRHIGHFHWRIAEDRDAAYKYYIKALNLCTTDIEAAVGAAEIALCTSDYDTCIKLLSPFAEEKPFYSRYWKVLGIACIKSALPASKHLQNALRGTSDDITDGADADSQGILLSWLGDAYVSEDRLQAAYTVFARIPDLPYSRMALAQVCIRLQLFYEAIVHSEFIDNLVVKDNTLVDAYCGLLQQFLERGYSFHELVEKLSVLKDSTHLTYSSLKSIADVLRKLMTFGLDIPEIVCTWELPQPFSKLASTHKAIACLYHKALGLAETPVQKSRIWVDLCLLVASVSTPLAEQCALKAIQLHADKNSCYAMALARKGDMEQVVHYASKAIAMDHSFAPAWELLLEVIEDDSLRKELRERARYSCPGDHLITYLNLEEHSYTSLWQMLSLRPSGPTTKYNLEQESECPAYYSFIYRDYLDAFVQSTMEVQEEHEWCAIKAATRIRGLFPDDNPSRTVLLSIAKKRGLAALASSLQ